MATEKFLDEQGKLQFGKLDTMLLEYDFIYGFYIQSRDSKQIFYFYINVFDSKICRTWTSQNTNLSTSN